MLSRAIGTIVLLCVSNTFMTFAWYGNLKMQQVHPQIKDWPLILIILMSWGIPSSSIPLWFPPTASVRRSMEVPSR